MISTVLSLFVVHTIEVWAWAIVFVATGAIDGFDRSLYFSTVTFSTLGYGDVILTPEWRLIGALEAISGLLAAVRQVPVRAISGESFPVGLARVMKRHLGRRPAEDRHKLV